MNGNADQQNTLPTDPSPIYFRAACHPARPAPKTQGHPSSDWPSWTTMKWYVTGSWGF